MKSLEFYYFYREVRDIVIDKYEIPEATEDRIVYMYDPTSDNYIDYKWGAFRPSPYTPYNKIESVNQANIDVFSD